MSAIAKTSGGICEGVERVLFFIPPKMGIVYGHAAVAVKKGK
jgi:hypothetical protein